MYQKTQIIGRLGGDPEMRYTSKGTPVTTFPVAVDGRGEKTTWFRVTAWGRLAEVCNRYLGRGRPVFVEGEIDVSAWKDRDGKPRATLELTAHTVKFLGKDNGNEPSTQEASKPEPVQTEGVPDTEIEPEPKPAPVAESRPTQSEPDVNIDDDLFDDLPF